jgi:hypothetical protein
MSPSALIPTRAGGSICAAVSAANANRSIVATASTEDVHIPYHVAVEKEKEQARVATRGRQQYCFEPSHKGKKKAESTWSVTLLENLMACAE